MNDRMIKADRKLRQLVIGICVLSVLIVLVLTGWVLPRGVRYLERQEPRTILWVLEAGTALIFLSVVPMAIYLYCFGRRIVRHRQLPPPGTRVVVNTRLIEGDRAVTRGRIVMALAIVLLALGLVGGLYFPYRLEQVFGVRVQKDSSTHVEPAPSAPAP